MRRIYFCCSVNSNNMVSRLCATISLVVFLCCTTTSASQCTTRGSPTKYISYGNIHCSLTFIDGRNFTHCYGACASSVYLEAAVSEVATPQDSEATAKCTGTRNCCVGTVAYYDGSNFEWECIRIDGAMYMPFTPSEADRDIVVSMLSGCVCDPCDVTTLSGTSSQPMEHRTLDPTTCINN